MRIDVPRKEEFEEVNRLARQVHELHVDQIFLKV